MSDKIVTFLGCGSWGAALGAILAEKGIFVRYWHRNESAINEMQASRKHYLLNDIDFNENISFFPEIESAVNQANVIVLAVPSQHIRAVITKAKKHIDPSAIIINVAKGIENETLKIMSEVILEINGNLSNYVTLSGPSHAEEVVGPALVRYLRPLEDLPYVAEVRIIGAIAGIELVDDDGQPAPELVSKVQIFCLDQGVLVYAGGWYDNVLMLVVPLVINDDEIDLALSSVVQAITTIKP